MRQLLIQVGNDGQIFSAELISAQLPALAGAILSDVEDGLGEFISTMFIHCVASFPAKCSLYACLLALINEEDGEFTAQIIRKVASEIEQRFSLCSASDEREARSLLFF